MSDRLTTGITALDRGLGGGALPGSVIALTAPPESESGLLVREFVAQRPTLYLTTVRDAPIVRERLSRHDVGEVDIVEVDPDPSLMDATEKVTQAGEGWNVVVDTIDPLEAAADDDALQHFLNDLKLHVMDQEGAALLHCTRHEDDSPLRATTLTLADAVWDLRSTVGTNEVEEHLVVRKFAGGDATDEIVNLEFDTRVSVDTSRDIS